ncbi:UNVERIFIED_CONTAM: hypothetical protein K2H54_042590, partial [Gekko kuhli]
MWSGLLPPGVNESDVDTSSDEETLEVPGPILKEERELKDFKGASTSDFKTGETESITESKPASAVADDTQEFQTCPSGVSLDMWNKFQNLQKKNLEMKIQTNRRERRQKKKHSRKVKLKTNDKEEDDSQQSTNENWLREITQYFGINNRFESRASKEGTPKSGLEISIDKALADGDTAQAEELSDKLATRE